MFFIRNTDLIYQRKNCLTHNYNENHLVICTPKCLATYLKSIEPILSSEYLFYLNKPSWNEFIKKSNSSRKSNKRMVINDNILNYFLNEWYKKFSKILSEIYYSNNLSIEMKDIRTLLYSYLSISCEDLTTFQVDWITNKFLKN